MVPGIMSNKVIRGFTRPLTLGSHGISQDTCRTSLAEQGCKTMKQCLGSIGKAKELKKEYHYTPL